MNLLHTVSNLNISVLSKYQNNLTIYTLSNISPIVPDETEHGGVRVVDGTEPRQYGHQCDPDNPHSANTLLYREYAWKKGKCIKLKKKLFICEVPNYRVWSLFGPVLFSADPFLPTLFSPVLI